MLPLHGDNHGWMYPCPYLFHLARGLLDHLFLRDCTFLKRTLKIQNIWSELINYYVHEWKIIWQFSLTSSLVPLHVEQMLALPFGLKNPKYPDVSFCFVMISSRMFPAQTSPSHFLHVSESEKKTKKTDKVRFYFLFDTVLKYFVLNNLN